MEYIIVLLVVIIISLIIVIFCLENSQINYGPNEYINPSALLYIKKSDVGGKGVFANRNIKKGEILEFSPYIEDNLDKFIGVVRDYVFSKDSNRAIVAFGYSSMYNHSDEPSATWDVEEDGIKITATKNINKDDEIFISYGKSYWNTRSIEMKSLNDSKK